MHTLAFGLYQRRWLLFALGLGALLLLPPLPPGLTEEGRRVLVITVMATICFVTDPVPLPAIAMLLVFGQILLGVQSPSDVAHAFMGDSVFFIMGSLMIAAAIVHQHLDRRIAWALLRLTGPSIRWVVAGLVVVAALLSSVIGEHTVAAILVPVCLTMVGLEGRRADRSPGLAKLLLLAVAFGCMTGSPGTPSGGARNAIVLEYWQQLYGISVGYWGWVVRAYPIVLARIPLLVLVLWLYFRPGQASLSRVFVELRREVQRQGPMSGREGLAVALLALVVGLWLLESKSWGLGGIAIFGAAAYLILGVVSWPAMSSGVNWGVILVYGSTISLGIAMTKTGAATWLAECCLGAFQHVGLNSGPLLYIPVTVFTAALTNVQSSASAVSIVGPVALQMAKLGGCSLVGMGLACGIASAFSFLTVISSPASLIVYATGLLRPSDFLKVGAWAMLVSFAALALLVLVWWPLVGV